MWELCFLPFAGLLVLWEAPLVGPGIVTKEHPTPSPVVVGTLPRRTQTTLEG